MESFDLFLTQFQTILTFLNNHLFEFLFFSFLISFFFTCLITVVKVLCYSRGKSDSSSRSADSADSVDSSDSDYFDTSSFSDPWDIPDKKF